MDTVFPVTANHRVRRTEPRSTLQRVALLLLVSTLASGCAGIERYRLAHLESVQSSATASDDVETVVTAEEVMINDLVSAIVQILPPADTIVQYSDSTRTELQSKVTTVLAQRGYALQQVSTDQGPLLLSVDRFDIDSDSQMAAHRLRITLGELSVSREYSLIADDAVQPNAPFRLYGTRASIDMNATLFGASTVASDLASRIEYTAPAPIDDPLPTLSLITPEVVQEVAQASAEGPSRTSLNSAQVEVNNLFYSGTTFGSVFEGYEPVEDLIVVFPNDSVVLGSENKRLISRFVDQFVDAEHLLSVIGCSNGPTALEMGNVGLALGRAERVTEELIGLGVPRTKVLDEGCWAPQSVKKLPGRGVVLELWSNNANG